MITTNSTQTRFTTSADGTEIAYEVSGAGPALVLVDGALCHRSMGHARGLAAALAGDFTVHTYDRRGRGDSGPGSTAYEVQREIEDVVAVIETAGASAHVFGASSGAVLALEAARQGAPIDRIGAYEAPCILDDSRPPVDPDLPRQVQSMVDDGRRGEAVKTFLRTVGLPAPLIALMPLMPAWKKLTAVAHTLPYDLSIVAPLQQGRPLPDGTYDTVRPSTLVIAGAKSPEWMCNAQQGVAQAVPNSRLETLAGQTHMIKPKVVAPVITRHFLA